MEWERLKILGYVVNCADMKKILIPALLVVCLQTAFSQELSFWSIQGNQPYQKVDTLLAGQQYLLGIDSALNLQRAKLEARGLTYYGWNVSGSGIKNAFYQSGNLQVNAINISDGLNLDAQALRSFTWSTPYWQGAGDFYVYPSGEMYPTFAPMNYLAHTFSTAGTFTASIAGYGGYMIIDGNGTNNGREDVTATKTFTVVTSIPEPSSLSLLALGGIALALRKRNRV